MRAFFELPRPVRLRFHTSDSVDESRSASRAGLLVVFGAFAHYAWVSLPELCLPTIGTHAWRQAIAASSARLYAAGQPFLYPRVEACGAEPGLYMASEFPLYAWLMGKLGGYEGVSCAGRAIGLVCTLGLMLAIHTLVRWLLRSWPELARSGGAAAAAALIAVSPLYRFYGIGFLPDVPAHALSLLGAALIAGPLLLTSRDPQRPLSIGRFVLAVLLVTLGLLTKLIAAPHLALIGLVLLARAAPRPGLAGLLSRRSLAMGALLVTVAGLAIYLWYVRWNAVLRNGGCDMVWLPSNPDPRWFNQTLADAGWRAQVGRWMKEELLGPVWPLAIAGLPLLLLGGWRGGAFLIWAAGCAFSYARLGWHSRQHNYDLLLLLPVAACAAGMVFALAIRLIELAVSRFTVPARAGAVALVLALGVGVALLSPIADARSAQHWQSPEGELETRRALDKVLPAGEPIHYFGSVHDPKLAFLAARPARGSEPWLYCQRKQVRYDCVLASDTRGRLAPCIERGPAVAWANRSLVCGITTPDLPLVPDRILETIARSISHPQRKSIPGAGTLLGVDRVDARTVDLYFLPATQGPAVSLRSEGGTLPLRPAPESWLPGTVMVARATVSEDVQTLTLEAEGAGEVAIPLQ